MQHVQKVKRLYKTILRLHRGLPMELQVLGNEYTKDEFKRHKNCNETEAKIFMDQWGDYCVTLAKQLGVPAIKRREKIGSELNPDILEDLREEQIAQIYELFKAAKNLETDPHPLNPKK